MRHHGPKTGFVSIVAVFITFFMLGLGSALAIDIPLPGDCIYIVDDNGTGCSEHSPGGTVSYTGTWDGSTSTSGYFCTRYRHDRNQYKGTKSVVFTPDLHLDSLFNVYMWWTEGTNRAHNVPVYIDHALGTDIVFVNQEINGGQWNYLGTYLFNSGTSGGVTIRTEGTNDYVIADAVKFECVPGCDNVVADPLSFAGDKLSMNVENQETYDLRITKMVINWPDIPEFIDYVALAGANIYDGDSASGPTTVEYVPGTEPEIGAGATYLWEADFSGDISANNPADFCVSLFFHNGCVVTSCGPGSPSTPTPTPAFSCDRITLGVPYFDYDDFRLTIENTNPTNAKIQRVYLEWPPYDMKINQVNLDGSGIWWTDIDYSPSEMTWSPGSEPEVSAYDTERMDIDFNSPGTLSAHVNIADFCITIQFETATGSCEKTICGPGLPSTPTPTATPIDCGDPSAISLDSSASYNHGYELACLDVGTEHQPYTDATNRYITYIPSKYKGMMWLRTKHNDRNRVESDCADNATWVRFNTTAAITVHVGYNHSDPNNSSRKPAPPPKWLTDDYEFAYYRIGMNWGGDLRYWDLWSREYAAGSQVNLGANHAETYDGVITDFDSGMYIVIIEFRSAGGFATPTPTIVESSMISNIPAFFLDPPKPQVTILFDNSGSMTGGMGDTYGRNKITVGRDVLADLIDDVLGVRLGFATYDGASCSGKSYPGNMMLYNGCPTPPAPFNSEPPVGLEPRHPDNFNPYPCSSDVSPCSDRTTSANITNHPGELSDSLRRDIKYGVDEWTGGAGEQFWGKSHWDPLPPQSNKWNAESPIDLDFDPSTCYYSRHQGIEGIFHNVQTGISGWTPIAGSLYGMRDYYQQYHLPCELSPFTDCHDLTASPPRTGPEFSAGAFCTTRYIILISDGLETCGGAVGGKTAVDAAAALRSVKVDIHNPADPLHGTWSYDSQGDILEYDIKTFVVGLNTGNAQFFNDVAQAGGTDAAYSADSSEELTAALSTAISLIVSGTYAGSAVAIEANKNTAKDYLYRAVFFPEDWHGDVTVYALDANGDIPADYPDNPIWSVANWMLDYWGSIGNNYTTDAAKTSLTSFNSVAGSFLTSNELNYVLGSPTKEIRNGGSFRNRSLTPFGDVVHSSPLFVGAPPFSYEGGGASYSAFASDNQNRMGMLYFGANDGFLYAVKTGLVDEDGNPNTNPEDEMAVLWRYAPYDQIPKMAKLTDREYDHSYFVDGSPIAADIYNASSVSWKTVVAFGLRGGGKSYEVIDVTDPEVPVYYLSYSNPDKIGYTVSKPSIVPMGDGSWVMWVTSGLENNDDKGHVLGIGLDGENYPVGSVVGEYEFPLGHYVTAMSLVDSDFNGKADRMYVGDGMGYLWSIQLSLDGSGSYTMTDPLFKAYDEIGTPQPITGAPEVSETCAWSEYPSVTANAFVVFFGTGKFYHTNDRIDTSSQTFYAVLDSDNPNVTPQGGGRFEEVDSGSGPAPVIGSDATYLTRLTLVDTPDGRTIENNDFLRLNTAVTLMDLPTAGERVITQPIALNGNVFFVSAIPNWDECGSGGTSFFYGIPFYTTCIEREDQPELGDTTTIEYVDDGILLEPPSHHGEYGYGLTTDDTIFKVPMETRLPEVQNTSWREIF